MYKDLTVPENNSLKKEIKEMLSWLDKKEADNELGRTTFAPACTEEKMAAWESANGIKIPESYKEWLRFTEECTIDGTTAQLFGPDHFRTDYVPSNLIVIGEVVGDGEQVCFDKETGEIVTWFEGACNFEFENVAEIIEWILRQLGKVVKKSKSDKKRELKKIINDINDKSNRGVANESDLRLLSILEESLRLLNGEKS